MRGDFGSWWEARCPQTLLMRPARAIDMRQSNPVQKDKMDLFIRTVGIAARVKIGMANIVYNMKRAVFLDNPCRKRKSWLRESGQFDKWLFCLTTAILAEDQEIR